MKSKRVVCCFLKSKRGLCFSWILVTAKWFCIKTPVESYEAKNIFLAG